MAKLKSLVIIYHKNIEKIYKEKWIKKSISSIINQTYQDFDIWELNYGDNNISYIDPKEIREKNYKYIKKEFDNHVYAMYYLLSRAFNDNKYDIVFNTNIDDYNHPQRFEKQLELIKYGYDIVFTYWQYIEDINDNDQIKFREHCKNKQCPKCGNTNGLIKFFDEKALLDGKQPTLQNIKDKLDKNTNILCHPSTCYTIKMWNTADNNGNLLRYRNEKPYEDMRLWQRILTTKLNIGIVPESLIYYRIHSNQVSKINPVLEEPKKRRIGILLVCTGKYTQFLKNVIISIENNFFKEKDNQKIYFIFSDDFNFVKNLMEELKVKYFFTQLERRGFPADTLYRYNYFLKQKYNLQLHTDIVYYFDVDMRVEKINPEDILPTLEKPLIGTRHPGYYLPANQNGTPETNNKSTAYINPEKYNKCYIAGGFNGGYTDKYLEMSEEIVKRIDIDDTNEIIAVWHDESHLNKYMNMNYKKFKILQPEYCYPESWKIPFDKKILALEKKHDSVRIDDIIYITPELGGNIDDKLNMISTVIAYGEKLKEKLKDNKINIILPIKSEKTHTYRNSLFSNFLRGDINKIEWKNTDMNKLEKLNTKIKTPKDYNYFNNYKNIILNKIKLPSDKQQNINNIFMGIRNLFEGPTVSMYISRTEYENIMKNDINYFTNSVKYMETKIKDPYYIIYLDKPKLNEIPKVIQNMKKVYILDKTYHDYILLYLLSKCENHILSNTNFSWWVGYLSENQNNIICSKDVKYKILNGWNSI